MDEIVAIKRCSKSNVNAVLSAVHSCSYKLSVGKYRLHKAVSYTHLDVYKRQPYNQKDKGHLQPSFNETIYRRLKYKIKSEKLAMRIILL